MNTSSSSTARSKHAPVVDLLAVLKGATAMVAAVPLLRALGLCSAWAFMVGCAVIAIEKRNHARGRRDRPLEVAIALAACALVLALVLAVVGGTS